MFGILAGLIGRAATGAMSRRPMGGAFRGGFRGGFGGGLGGGGGLLGGLLQRRARPMSFSSGGGGGSSMPTQQAPQEAQQQRVQAQAQPVNAPPPQQQVEQIPQDVQPQPGLATAEQPTADKLVTDGLLDEAPAYSPPPEPRQEAVTPARQVANQTEALTPVAPQEDKAFGVAPMPLPPALEGLVDQEPPQRTFEQADPNPTKPADTKSQARHGQGGPQYSFQTMGSWTASVPNYSYRRQA